MPGGNNLPRFVRNFNPGVRKKRSRAEIAAEVARVDAVIDELAALPVVSELSAEALAPFRALGEVSVPVALRSLRHYRQRLARVER